MKIIDSVRQSLRNTSLKKRNIRKGLNRRRIEFQLLESRLVFSGLPLLDQTDFDYLGAFRVPKGQYGPSTFAYGGTAPAYNAQNNSLFMVGHDWDQAIAEISIPPLVNSPNLSDLKTASILQPFSRVQANVPNWSLNSNSKIGGLQVVGETIVGTFFEYYDADASAVDSHFRLSSLDLDEANTGGLYQVGSKGGGFVGGYMAEVPVQWRDELGMPYITGQGALSIISRTSAGPAAFGFDPQDLGPEPAEAIDFVSYPLPHPLAPEASTNPWFNLTTEITGVVFPPNSSSVIFIGSHGTGDYCYGEAADCNDPVRNYKGTHSVGGEYEYQAWAYNVNDFIAVKNGLMQSWEVKPYDVWTFDFPISESQKHIGGVAFDEVTGRLYVSQQRADHTGYDPYPVIHVFQLPYEASNANQPPTLNPQNFRIDENAPAGSYVGTIIASDPDGDALEYTIIDGDESGAFHLDPLSGVIEVKESQFLNYEVQQVYELHVRVTDSHGSSVTGLVQVAVNDVFETGPSIENLRAIEQQGGSVDISWVTNIPGTSKVEYGLTIEFGLTAESSANYVTDHSLIINDLLPGRSYYYRAISQDADGNVSFSDISSFSTSPTGGVGGFSYANPKPLEKPDLDSSVYVSSVAQLSSAIGSLVSGQTILIAPGVYDLTGVVDALYIPQGIKNWSIRGATGNREDVIIRGDGMDGSVRFGFWLGNVSHGIIADLTIDGVRDHGIIANAGADDILFHGLRIIDSGNQFIKSNPGSTFGNGNSRGVVQYSVFEYRNTDTDNYTNAIDVHGGSDWVIQYNFFKNILSPPGLGVAGPAILIWAGSSNTVVNGNTFFNVARGVSLGLVDVVGFDHSGGLISNNMFYRDFGLGSAVDVPIYIGDSPNTAIVHNTVLDLANYPNSIEYRFASTTNVNIHNNLTNQRILARDGAMAILETNLDTAHAGLFVDPVSGDLHLLASASMVIDQGSISVHTVDDWDGQIRDESPDIGADELLKTPTPINLPPLLESQAFSVVENPMQGAVVGTVVAVDPEGQPLIYSIESGNQLDAFNLEENSGVLTVANSAILDFEQIGLFELVINVSDVEGLIGSAKVVVVLEDVNEQPTVEDHQFSIETPPATGMHVGTIYAVDPDQDDELLFQITGGNEGETFALDPVTGVLAISSTWTGSALPSSLSISVTDSGGLADTATLHINSDYYTVSHFKFSEGSGTVTYDQVGRSARISGARWTDGQDESGLRFDGRNDMVTVKSDRFFSFTEEFTIAAWVRPSSTTNWRTVVLKERPGGLAYGLYAADDNSSPAVYVNLGGRDLHATASRSLPLNVWSHLAATFDGEVLKLFVDGVEVARQVATGSVISSDSPLRFGGNRIWGEYFAGALDEIVLSDVALTETAIADLGGFGRELASAGIAALGTVSSNSETPDVTLGDYRASMLASSRVSGYIETERKIGLDVNGDGRISPLDALFIINALSRSALGKGTWHEAVDELFRLDANRDGVLSALDALIVINHLNTAHHRGEADNFSLLDTSTSGLARSSGGTIGVAISELGEGEDEKRIQNSLASDSLRIL